MANCQMAQEACVKKLGSRSQGQTSCLPNPKLLRCAIDERYGKWAYAENEDAGMPVKRWRGEPERFAIQLSVADKKDEKMNIAEAGTKPAIYIAFGGGTACSLP
jgi:hypothetical protein